MQPPTAAHAVADVDVAARHLLQEEREVLAGGHRLGLGMQAVVAEPVAHHLLAEAVCSGRLFSTG
jgi:hypothetical protein